MICFPNAKINIGLNVVEKRTDGYHNLETIFYPVKLSDALEIVKSEKTEFTTSGIPIDGDSENNLVLRAYRLLQAEFDLSAVKIHLHKMIPFGAGLGGGSADAAFALKMLNRIFNLNLSTSELESYASKIGADCPFFIQNKPTFAHGIGDQFKEVKVDLSNYKVVIVKPPYSVSTAEAYRNIQPAKADFDLMNIASLPIDEWKNVIRNDFENSVFPIYPEIKEIKQKLYNAGAIYASMSGSGSAVFGIFRHLPVELSAFLPKSLFIYR
ncbi:MAG TPA: 4-(cytidine 5'-diphospho)-2-C-methyl-D-erythritol kinase [Draconibacterium sp.]|nr:4-(cytidine 5'-diphospho)-2-C-methyl-D-erythritol kinase [Draconibacterium sp.]